MAGDPAPNLAEARAFATSSIRRQAARLQLLAGLPLSRPGQSVDRAVPGVARRAGLPLLAHYDFCSAAGADQPGRHDSRVGWIDGASPVRGVGGLTDGMSDRAWRVVAEQIRAD